MSEAAPKVGSYYVEARDTMARAVSGVLAYSPELAERLQACNTPEMVARRAAWLRGGSGALCTPAVRRMRGLRWCLK